jgi:hypothetical protein
VAVRTVVPRETGVTAPVDELTVATEGFDETYVIAPLLLEVGRVGVKSSPGLFVRVPVLKK